MSLIQQALKRKLDEEQGRVVAPPPLPPGPPPEPPPPPPASLGKPMLLVLLLLLLVVGGLALLFTAGRSLLPRLGLGTADAGPEPKVASTPAPVPAPTPAISLPLTTVPIEQVIQKVGALKAAVAQARAEGPEAIAVPAPAGASTEPAAAVAAKPAPAPAPAPVAQPATGEEPVPGIVDRGLPPGWPAMKLTGVITRTAVGKSAAIINNSLVNVDETIHGVRLVEIRDGGAVIEFKGERRLLNIGEGTP